MNRRYNYWRLPERKRGYCGLSERRYDDRRDADGRISVFENYLIDGKITVNHQSEGTMIKMIVIAGLMTSEEAMDSRIAY